MILLVDNVERFGIGGWTTNLSKMKYNLSRFGMSLESLLEKIPDHAVVPTTMFYAGRYVVICQFNRDLLSGRMAFIDFEIDLQKHFDLFADSFTPKTVQGFYTIQEQLKLKSPAELNAFSLSEETIFQN